MNKKSDNSANKRSDRPVESDKLPEDKIAPNETDPDELIHTMNDAAPEGIAKHDPDEAVHLEHGVEPNSANELDVDDMMHGRDLHEEDI